MLPVWFPQPGTMVLLLDLLHRLHSPVLPDFPVGGHIRPRDKPQRHLCPQTLWEEVEDRGGGQRWRRAPACRFSVTVGELDLLVSLSIQSSSPLLLEIFYPILRVPM